MTLSTNQLKNYTKIVAYEQLPTFDIKQDAGVK